MNKRIEKALKSIPMGKDFDREYNLIDAPYTIFTREDGTVGVTDEQGVDCSADYEYRTEVHPDIAAWAKKNRIHVECDYPGTFTFHEE